MGSAHWKRVCERILPLSRAQDLLQAFKEWRVTDRVTEDEEVAATCGLCDKEGLRYQYEICNQYTQYVLWVGSECILKFVIPVFEAGVLLDPRSARRKLNRLRKRPQHDSCVKTLERVVGKENNPKTWDILRSALDYYRQNEYLTPRYAYVVFWRLKEHKIDHIPKLFKVGSKEKKDKIALRDMSDSHVNIIWPALSPGQRRLAAKFGHHGPQL